MNRRIGFGLFALFLAIGAAQAHETVATTAPRALGHIDFPTSARAPEAQAAFIEGMLLLHLFEYDSAASAFRRAQQLEPGFALAHWGEAMTYTHPVWNQQDMAAGRAALQRLAPDAKARAAKAGSARERDFLQIAEILYGEGDKPRRDQRVLAHVEAMAQRYPGDDEVQAQLALALLGVDQGVRDVPRFLRAAEISRGVFRRNPQHAGAAHYWIHGMDDPAHAKDALEAARALSKIAPDAGHSQHMTSHIFVALGQWQDVVAANLAATHVVNAGLAASGRPPYSCGHNVEWLQYAYFQLGRYEDGVQVLEECVREGEAALAWMRAHPGEAFLAPKTADALQARFDWSVMMMRAFALAEMSDVPHPMRRRAAAVPVRLEKLGRDAAWHHFAEGLVLARGGQKDEARAELGKLEALAAAPAEPGDNGRAGAYFKIMAKMLGALLDERDPVGQARAAAAEFDQLSFDYGPPATIVPPHEFVGDLLMDAQRYEEAASEYERGLAQAPGRYKATRNLGLATNGTTPATDAK